jgi:hypothetical protein
MPPELGGSPAREVPSLADCERRLGLTPEDRRQVAAEVLRRMRRPPFTNQVDHAARIAALQGEVDGVDDPARIAEAYEWALRQNPDDRVLNLLYGLHLRRSGQPGADAYLQRARPTDGSPVPTGVYDH